MWQEFFANIAMLVNVLVVVAVMAMFGATLTLPGMAGLVFNCGYGGRCKCDYQ